MHLTITKQQKSHSIIQILFVNQQHDRWGDMEISQQNSNVAPYAQ